MIELPGHEVIVPNAVFARPTPDFRSKYMLVLDIFHESKPSETWDFLVSKVDGFYALKEFSYKPKDELEFLIAELPEKYQKQFVKFKKRFGYLVLGDIDEDAEPARKLEIDFGVMPLSIVDGHQDLRWYNRKLMELMSERKGSGKRKDSSKHPYGLGELFHVEITVENDVLPSLERIANAIVLEGTFGSRTLNIMPDDYDPDEVMPVVELVYKALEGIDLKKLKEIKELKDLAVATMQGILAEVKSDYRTT